MKYSHVVVLCEMFLNAELIMFLLLLLFKIMDPSTDVNAVKKGFCLR